MYNQGRTRSNAVNRIWPWYSIKKDIIIVNKFDYDILMYLVYVFKHSELFYAIMAMYACVYM